MSRLLLVRHGITEFNSSRRLAGYSDVEMNADGYRQVEKLRERLANEKIDAIYSSDLGRALVTAQVISGGREVDIVPCPELREMNYGDAEGLPLQEIRLLYPEVAELMASYSLQLRFPGGESLEGLIERTGKFLDRLEKHTPSETLLIVAHNGPLKVLLCHLLGIDCSHWRQIRLDNASMSIVETNRQRATISLLNDTSHLREDI
ncbi:MAG: histidine phosphatase family protein [Chloroflexi bacterium]|nr:histidine phosphatase family protein [Chloroflexota bacterium]